MADIETTREGGSFDPETVQILQDALDEAWASLVPAQQTPATKSEMAKRILAAADEGERDPAKLKSLALINALAQP
jgi:hypothetical protein